MYVMGDNSIFKLAQDAKDKTNQAIEDEQKGMNTLVSKINSILNNEVEAPEGSLLEMYRQAVKDGCDNSDGSCTRADHLHIGDYVNYQEPTTGSYTVSTEKSGTSAAQTYTLSATKNNVNWRVLGVDSTTGGIKLIAADPIQAGEADGNAPYLNLKGAEAYLYGPTEMDNICRMYKDTTYATAARSVTMDDIDQITGVTTTELKKATNFWTLQGSKQLGETYSVTGYTPENWLKKKAGETIEKAPMTGTVTGYAYPIFKTEEEAGSMQEALGELTAVVLKNTRAYNMLFDSVDYGTGKDYWLASRGVIADSGSATFGPGVVGTGGGLASAVGASNYFFSSGGEDEGGLSVRPVVILRSDVLESNMKKVTDQPSTWPGVNTTP